MIRRRLAATLLAVATVAVLAACSSLPTSGHVETGSTITNNVQNDIEYLPSGPVAGSDQERIVRDFIEAGTGSQGDYKVAREYLTSSFAKKWNPHAGVLVRQGSGTVSQITPNQITYTVQSAATVDAQGHYSEAQGSTQTSLRFGLVKVSGEWRLSYAPPGIVLTTANFDLVFRPHAVYFYDPTYAYLVPDERWFLARSSTTTRIAQALLAGPSTWLKGAVVSAFPSGTGLANSGVSVSSGTAHVDLSSQASSADATARSRMRAQLVASFSTVSSVGAVSISVDGATLAIPDDTGSGASTDPAVDARPMILSKNESEFGFGSSTGVSQIAGLSKAIVALHPTSVEVSDKLNLAAVGTVSGVYAVSSSGASKKVDSRGDLIAPTMDDLGYVWSAKANDPRSITAFAADGTPHTIQTSLPAAEQLVAFAISRDSTRIAMLIDADGTTKLLVAAILRDSKHVPTGLGTPLSMTPPSGSPVAVTWVDELTVATLSTDTEGNSLVSEHDVGGESTDLGRPTGTGVDIVGGNGVDRVRILTSNGNLLEPRGNGWEDTGISAALLATQR
ncbi:GerMN domain-containing protein [Frondihabitans australicus]|uniref:Sporulation and spore germination protein n=1 Tax=Frondihabitans australicus TaxID=386892 RepID=A0A495IDR7_9MICO|nr:GerMN domain-containing protein [Frondihabitans australicus]RKR73275.1 sporulation and spore germination protein [Frondihabitans australicus]